MAAKTPPDRDGWRARRLERLLPWDKAAVRPGEIVERLKGILLDRANLLEDADYRKYTPNYFVVELNEANYQQQFAPIAERISEQWRLQLQEHLATANSRQGRLVYRLYGPLRVELRPSASLAAHEARFLFRMQADSGPRLLPACLERVEDSQRWRLHEGIVSIGRESFNDIVLDTPTVQAARLVSSRHAYLRCQDGNYWLYDGDPGGTASVNGTYVGHVRITTAGYSLHDGDTIILAALLPGQPNPNTPGIGVLRFILDCPE